MIFVTFENKDSSYFGVHVVNNLSYIVNFLFGDGLCVNKIKTVQVAVLRDLKVLVNFIEYLPSDVVIDLLFHLLVLIK